MQEQTRSRALKKPAKKVPAMMPAEDFAVLPPSELHGHRGALHWALPADGAASPAAQPSHLAPPDAAKVPALQLAQPAAPGAAAYVPAPHSTQAVAPAQLANWPALHGAHVALAGPSAKAPAGQLLHAARSLAPVAGFDVPAAHLMHAPAPDRVWAGKKHENEQRSRVHGV